MTCASSIPEGKIEGVAAIGISVFAQLRTDFGEGDVARKPECGADGDGLTRATTSTAGISND
jgi:hypothetical protein